MTFLYAVVKLKFHMLINIASRIRTSEWAPWKPLLSDNVFVGAELMLIAVYQ